MMHPFIAAELVRQRRAELQAEAVSRRPVRQHDRRENLFPWSYVWPRITMKRA
jgi:hypothetical protein